MCEGKVIQVDFRKKHSHKWLDTLKFLVRLIQYQTVSRKEQRQKFLDDEFMDFLTGKIEMNEHLLPPGKNCYTREQIEKDILEDLEYYRRGIKKNDQVKKNDEERHDHIISCKRCRSISYRVYKEVGENNDLWS